jgi:prepilin-type processing-associated H-X9-DG protein
MKNLRRQNNFWRGEKCRAFTRRELAVVIAVVGVGAVLLFSGFQGLKGYAVHINCYSALRSIGLAYRIWEGDNNDHYPAQSLTNELGAPLYTDSANAFRYFQVMSNELCNPRILVCPADPKQHAATNFTSDFSSGDISYFTGLDASETNVNSCLVGDSNLTNGTQFKNGLAEFTTNQLVGWTKERHHEAGNVGFADGSVQYLNSRHLQQAIQKTGLSTNRLLMP